MAPDPLDDRVYSTLDEAFRDRNVSLANQPFIRRLLAGIDVASLHGRIGYLKVKRVGGGPSLQVHVGFTNGFRSADEIRDAVPEAAPWQSRRGTDLWGVSHPEHGHRTDGAERVGAHEPRDFGTCPTCFTTLPATGRCDLCE